MLRVLYSFPHPYGAPGIGTTARKQVESLARLGHDVTLVTTSTTVDPGVRTVRTMQRGLVRIPHRAFGVERAWAYHDLVASRLLRGYDVVHAWPLGSRHTLAAAARLGVAGFREAPNCHTEHAYEVVGSEHRRLGLVPPAGHSHAHSAGRLATERAEYAAATKVLVPSPFVERTFLERGVTNLARHRYGYDPADFPAAPTRSPGPLRAVFIGQCEPRKGLHFALEAWRAAGVAGTFEIYGSFMPGYREVLGALPAGVTIKGFTNDVRSVYGAADVLLLPSLEEGSALVTYEAQAMGAVPLVSAAAGAYCEHDVSGLIHEPADVAALTDHLCRAADAQTLDRLRVGALANRGELTWDAAARVVVGHYEAAVSALHGA